MHMTLLTVEIEINNNTLKRLGQSINNKKSEARTIDLPRYFVIP